MKHLNLLLVLSVVWLGIAVSGCASSHNVVNASFPEQADNAVLASTTQLLPLEVFFNESSITDVKLSNDGKWLAWLQNYNGIRNIYVKPVHSNNASDGYPLTQSSEPISEFFWDNETLDLYYAQDTGGDENYQLYHLTTSLGGQLHTEKITRLTLKDEVSYQFIRQLKTDSNTLLVVGNHDDSSRMDAYYLNTQSGDFVRVFRNDKNFSDFATDENGKVKVGVAGDNNNAYSVWALVKDEWKNVLQTQPGEEISIEKYNEDDGLLYFTAALGEQDKQSLQAIDINTGQQRVVHQDPQESADVYSVHFGENGKPQIVSYYYGHKAQYFLDKNTERQWTRIVAQLPSGMELTLLQRNEDKGTWLLNAASDVNAGEVYFYSETNGQLTHVLSKDTVLVPALLAKRQSITYQARDGETIQAYLTLPNGKNSGLPTIVLPHGGPWARDYWTLNSGYFSRVAQLLANRGYAVLQPNFRASTGFGKRFFNLGNQNWGTGYMQHDLTDGANYLVKQGITDPKRIGILGGSYGGYAALSGITFTPNLYKASVSFVGPSNLVTLMESFPDYWRPYLGVWFRAVGDPQIDDDVENMLARSPINFVSNIRTPLLVVQGANDPRVVRAESEQIVRAMYKKGLDVEYLLADDEGHGFQKRINNLAFLVKMERFFALHLGGKVSESVPKALEQHLRSLEVDIATL